MKIMINMIAIIILTVCSCTTNASTDKEIQYGSNSAAGQYVEVDGIKLYVEIYGQGEPLILLHGGVGSINGFQTNIPELAKYFQVIAYDRGGHGRSFDSGKRFHYQNMAKETVGLMDALEIESAYLVGFSDGAVVGYHAGHLFPDRIKKLIAVGGNVGADNMMVAPEKFEAWLNPEAPAEWVRNLEPEYTNLSPTPNFKSYIQRSRDLWIGDSYPTMETMKEINVPVLIVTGDRNDLPLEHALEVYRSLKQGELCVIPNCDHFVFDKRPALVNQIAIEYFQDQQ